MQVWNGGISVKVFRQISLFIHYFYLFSKLMIRLDYQPPVRENEPALIPPKEGGSKTAPGRRRKSSLVNDSHIYLFSHKQVIYLFSKLMIRLDYHPLFGKMSPHSSPRRREDQRLDPGDGGNRAQLMIHIHIYFHTNKLSWWRTYSHLLFKKECSVKRLLSISYI